MAGCITTGVDLYLKASPAVAAFTSQYPNAKIITNLIAQGAVSAQIENIRKDCENPDFPLSSYYKTTLSDEASKTKLTVWMDSTTYQVTCAVKEGQGVKTPVSNVPTTTTTPSCSHDNFSQCKNKSDCESAGAHWCGSADTVYSCTLGECSGTTTTAAPTTSAPTTSTTTTQPNATTTTVSSTTTTVASTTTTTTPVTFLPKGTIIVTSKLYKGDLRVGVHSGAYAADLKCNATAKTAGWGAGRWMALISNGTYNLQSLKNRLSSELPYPGYIPDMTFRKFDGTIIANNKADLFDGSINSPINLNEYGDLIYDEDQTKWGGDTPPFSSAWTGSLSDGTSAESKSPYDNICGGWKRGDSFEQPTVWGMVGSAHRTDKRWIERFEINCGNEARLFCLLLDDTTKQ